MESSAGNEPARSPMLQTSLRRSGQRSMWPLIAIPVIRVLLERTTAATPRADTRSLRHTKTASTAALP